MQTDSYATDYTLVANLLMEYGGMAAPFMLGGEWEELRAFTQAVEKNPPADIAGRKTVESKANELIESAAYHPNWRAHLTYRSISLPHMCKCSHLLERATHHYYKKDFLSCTVLLLPAVEGVLRSYVGWTLGDPEPGPAQMRESLRSGRAQTYPERRQAYANAIASFHERWFWRHTDKADFSLSHLNRHYALHSLGSNSFYRAIDCHRLFLYFDTFADMLMYEGYGPKHVFLPDHEYGFQKRRDYYSTLIGPPSSLAETVSTAALPLAKCQAIEDELLREHTCYIPEISPPDLEQILLRFDRIMQPLPRNGQANGSKNPPRDGLRHVGKRLESFFRRIQRRFE